MSEKADGDLLLFFLQKHLHRYAGILAERCGKGQISLGNLKHHLNVNALLACAGT